jgi:hypothetical protein
LLPPERYSKPKRWCVVTTVSEQWRQERLGRELQARQYRHKEVMQRRAHGGGILGKLVLQCAYSLPDMVQTGWIYRRDVAGVWRDVDRREFGRQDTQNTSGTSNTANDDDLSDAERALIRVLRNSDIPPDIIAESIREVLERRMGR